MKIFVSGGTGFVGSYLCRQLLEEGHQLKLLVRQRKTGLAAGIEQVEGDATWLETFVDQLQGCDAAINLVGIIREFPGQGVTFERLHVDATANLLEAAQRHGCRRFLQMSALGTRPQAVSKYHQSKFSAEELVRSSGLATTIFRPSLIFGQGDAFVTMIADQITTLPAVPVIGDGSYQLQPIHAADVARCFALAISRPECSGQTYELCGPERLTYLELVAAVGRVLGKEHVSTLASPLFLMRLVTPLLQGLSFYPVTMDQIQMLTEGSICDSSWQQTFNFTPIGFSAGIAAYLNQAA